MTGDQTARAHRLQERLAANARRLRRREAAEALAKIGGAVAAACDSFTLHHRDPGLRAVERWIRRNGNGYSGRKPDVVVPVARADLVGQLRDIVGRHGLAGRCVLFPGVAVGRGGFAWAIGLDASEVLALGDLLLSPDNAFLASEAHRWCVNIHHEGELWLWRDIAWGEPDEGR